MRSSLTCVLAVLALTLTPLPAAAAAIALTGQVFSAREGAMEGVLVSARKDGSTITTTVVSDARGQYSFPADRLAPGRYSLRIRAVGFDLESPKTADVTAAGNVTANVRLVPTKDLTAQLTNSEWVMSSTGDEDMKKVLYTCMQCHTLDRIFKSTYTADQWVRDVLPRMVNYSSQAFPGAVQTRIVPRDIVRQFGDVKRLADYLASINLSRQKVWSFPLKTFARPKGASTRVIVTEYALPRAPAQPHDVIVDGDGMVWFSNFSENQIGRLDPTTGRVTEYSYPINRSGYATGNLDLEIDQDGNLWIGRMNQTGVAKFDRKTGAFTHYPLPANMLNHGTQTAMVAPAHWKVDNKVWFNDAENRTVGRLDLTTGKFDPWRDLFRDLPPGEPNSVYGIYADSRNNLFFLSFGGEKIGRIDAKTGAVGFYQTPTPRSRPRRGRMDAQDRLWFAEWRADKIGMLDTRTGAMKEWPIPGAYVGPYDVVLDRLGQVWSGNMNDDRITRLDPATGQTVQYLMPGNTNVRRVFVDNSTPRPTFWTGANHTASVVKVEPLP